MKRLVLFIILSIAVHAAFQAGLFQLAQTVTITNKDDLTLTEIEVVDLPENAEKVRPIIKQLTPNQPVINDQKMARFDSEKNQRVEKETKARQLGLTKNQNSKNLNTTKTEILDPNSLPEFTRMNLSTQQTSNSPSSISQILPNDIQTAEATNLNTDANTYYTFYNRVEELFYVRWAERLQYYWNKLSYDFKKNQLSGKIWSTTIEVWLSSNGEYHSSYILRSSGYKPFDEAAIFAFKDAKFFPNPPKTKIESDGFVRLKYRLGVHIDHIL